MRIGIYLENYDAGGVETVIANLITHWPVGNDEFVLVSNKEAEGVAMILKERLSQSFKKAQSDIISLPSLHERFPKFQFFIKAFGYYGRYLLILFNAFLLKRLFEGLKLDSIMIHNGGYPGAFSAVSAVIAARLCGIRKSLFVIHNLPQKIHLLHYPFDYVYDILVQKYSRPVCVSEKAAFQMQELRHFTKMPDVIHNGVVDRFTKSELSNRAVAGRFNIAVVGRLSSEKGHRFLFDAISKIKEQREDGWGGLLHVFGKGTEKQERDLKKIVVDLKLDEDIVFHGFVREMPKAIEGFDLLVLSSFEVESLPMVILEAMSLSIPVVATDIGGVCEIIEDGVSGLVVATRDPDALCRAILRLMDDSTLRARISKNGRQRFISEFTAAKMAHKYKDLLCE